MIFTTHRIGINGIKPVIPTSTELVHNDCTY